MIESPQRRRYSNEGRNHQHQHYTESSSSSNRMNSSLLTFDDEDMVTEEQRITTRTSKSQVVDKIVNAAQICNSLVSEYCGLCTFYIDQQVQYELIAGTANNVIPSSSPSTFDLQQQYGMGVRRQQQRDVVAQAAMMLFDEESVVESVSSR